MRAPDVPDPPDPRATASAQSAGDINTAVAQQLLNMTNQTGPKGSLTYSQSGSSSFTDPLTGKTMTIPRFTATTSLTPAQQDLLKQEEEFDKLYNTIGLNQTRRIGEHLSEPFKYDAGEYEGWAGNLYNTLNDESNARTRDQWDQKLKNQGLSPGSAAYDDAMKNVITSQSRDRTAFMLDAYNTGLNTALTMRNQPINEIGALISGGQVSMPSFNSTPTVGLQSPDIMGAYQNQYNQQIAARNSMMGGLSGLGAAAGQAIGGWAGG